MKKETEINEMETKQTTENISETEWCFVLNTQQNWFKSLVRLSKKKELK